MSQRSTTSFGLGVLGILGGTATAVVLPIACGGRSGVATLPATLDGSTSDAQSTGHPASDAAGDAAIATGTNGVDGGSYNPSGAQSGQAGMSGPTGFIRLADWAPDAPGPGFDVCVMPQDGSGTAWTGPLLGGAGVAFPNVGRYIAVAAGTYELEVVAPGGACGTAVAPTIQLAPLGVNARITAAIVGDLSPSGNDQAAKVVSFADDTAPPTTQAAVRFIDAMPGASSVVFGVGKMADLSFSALTPSVPFGTVSAALPDGGMADGNSYMLLGPLSDTTLSAHAPSGEFDISSNTSTSSVNGTLANPGPPSSIISGGTDLATGSNASWAPGSLVTVALVRGTGGSNGRFVLCHDDAPPQGSLAQCDVLAP